MTVPAPIITGTIVYAVIGALAFAGLFGARSSGMMSKDNAAIGHVVVSIAVFATWLFWLCAWLHQWHPLIKPLYEGGD
jgi:V-type H+-transporting ATPase subunit e